MTTTHAINEGTRAINEGTHAINEDDIACSDRITPVQRDVLRRLYGIGRSIQTVAEVARELGVRQYAVRTCAQKALRRIEAGRRVFGD